MTAPSSPFFLSLYHILANLLLPSTTNINAVNHWAHFSYPAYGILHDYTALNVWCLGFWDANYFPMYHGHGFWDPTNAAEFGLRIQSSFDDTGGPSASNHERTRSAPFLRAIASHAAARRVGWEGEGISGEGCTNNWSVGVEDGGEDSDSSFTPSDYRPKRTSNLTRGRDERYDGAQDDASQSDSSFTSSGHWAKPNADSGGRRDERHRQVCDDASVTDSSFTPSDYRVDNFRYYTAGDNEEKGSTGSHEGPCEYRHTRDDKGNHQAESSSNNSSSSGRRDDSLRDVAFTPGHYNPHTNKVEYAHGPPPVYRSPVLATLSLAQADGLSALFAQPNNPFTPFAPNTTAACDWPSAAELTSEGDGRIKRWDGDCTHALVAATVPHAPHPHTDTDMNTYTCDAFYPMTIPLPPGFTTNTTTSTTTTMMTADKLRETKQPPPNLGRFLPVPRLREKVDPRLGYTAQEVAWLVAGNGGQALPWEAREMAGERWDLHGGRRIWEVWARGGGVRFEDEVDGWDLLAEGEVGVRMGRALVDEQVVAEEDGTFSEDGEEEMVAEGAVEVMVGKEEVVQEGTEEEDA